MSESADPLLLIGRILVDREIITESDLEETLIKQAGHRALKWPGRRIGEHLVAAGLVDRRVLVETLKERDGATAEVRWAGLGDVAVRNGFLTSHQLRELLTWQRWARQQGETPGRIGMLLRRESLVTEQKLQAVIDRQRAIYSSMKHAPEVSAAPTSHPFIKDAFPQRLYGG